MVYALDPDKVKLVGYFKTDCRRHGWKSLKVEKFFKVRSDGKMAVVDETIHIID